MFNSESVLQPVGMLGVEEKKEEELVCSRKTYEEVFKTKRYSICSKCPKYESHVNLVPWDTAYVPESQRRIEMQESVVGMCTEYNLEKTIDFIRPKREPINLKKAKRS